MNDNEDFETMTERAFVLANEGRDYESQVLLEQAYLAYLRSARSYIERIRFREALGDWRSVLALAVEASQRFGETLPYAWAAASLALFRQGRFEESCQVAKSGIELCGSVPELRYELARNLAYQCRFEECVKELLEAAKLDPNGPGSISNDPDLKTALAWAAFEGIDLLAKENWPLAD